MEKITASVQSLTLINYLILTEHVLCFPATFCAAATSLWHLPLSVIILPGIDSVKFNTIVLDYLVKTNGLEIDMKEQMRMEYIARPLPFNLHQLMTLAGS
jgi:hypothetical protein